VTVVALGKGTVPSVPMIRQTDA